MKCKTLLAWACGLLISGAAFGVTYHIAPGDKGGDDSNSGLNWGEPKASLSNALAQGNVTEILVSNGTYNLTATVTND